MPFNLLIIMKEVITCDVLPVAMFLYLSYVWPGLISLRHNWLGDKHTIGRLLKPHTKGSIFIMFAARHALISEGFSLVEQQFSVFSLTSHSLQIVQSLGGEGWSFTACI